MAAWISADLSLQGVRLHYYRTGGDKPAVVLAHGFSDNGLCWTPVAQALEARYDVVMYDARGHGLSELPEQGTDRDVASADLAGLVRSLGLDKPVLMGHSMGAGTAAGAAARYRELARGVVLEDPGWRTDGFLSSAEERKAWLERTRQEMLRFRAMTREELLVEFRDKYSAWSEAEIGPLADAALQFNPRVAELLGGPRPGWQEVARAIACPALLITADADRGGIVTPEVAAEAAGLLKQGQVVHIPGAGRNIRRDQFGPYMEAVKAFLAQVFVG